MRELIAVLLALCLLPACAARDLRADLGPQQLYELALETMEAKDYEEAQSILDQIRDEFPFSPFAVEAELAGADLRYREGKFEEAAARYRSFEELHPTHAKLPYAIHRRGMSYWEIALPMDRDQSATRDAAEAFQKLLYAHPRSEYAASARETLSQVRERLAEHEVYVGRYYLRRKQYDAAIHRFQQVVADFPDTPQREQAEQLAQQAESLKAE